MAENDATSKSNLTRRTINVRPRGEKAIAEIMAETGDNVTDIMTLAVQVYASLLQCEKNGGGMYDRSPETKELIRMKFL